MATRREEAGGPTLGPPMLIPLMNYLARSSCERESRRKLPRSSAPRYSDNPIARVPCSARRAPLRKVETKRVLSRVMRNFCASGNKLTNHCRSYVKRAIM